MNRSYTPKIPNRANVCERYSAAKAPPASSGIFFVSSRQEGETEFMDGEPFPESKAVVIQDESCDYD